MTEQNVAVWVDEARCKACNICVSYCPSGTLAMREDQNAVQGMMIEVIDSSTCIGCRECENHCPDFAIYVAEKGFKFGKLTAESRALAEKIKANNFMRPKE